MEKEEIKKLANNLMFDVNDEEISRIQQDFISINKMLEMLDEINTDGVEEMVYPLNTITTYLRDDEPSKVISQEEAISNAHKVKQGHIVVPKVVK